MIIGISGSVLMDQSGKFAGYRRSYVNEDYVKAVLKANGTPLIIPVMDDEKAIEEIISKIDGLVLSGGHDVDPENYGEDPLINIGEIFPKRDAFDFMLIEKAKAKKIPILGICRGFQILNVYHGGSLVQDLSYLNTNIPIAHSQASGPTIKTHAIHLEQGSLLHEIFKEERIYVNSFHHQTVKEIGKDLQIMAYSDDGVIESFEHVSYPWLVGVQFHPEMLHEVDHSMQEIFDELVKQANK